MSDAPETEDERVARMVDERIRAVLRGEGFLPEGDDDEYGEVDESDLAQLQNLLAKLDETADSRVSKAMYAWLVNNSRLQKVGELYGGGYLFIYAEPEGTTEEGYVAGGTAGDRHVDRALEQVQAERGPVPPRRSICKACLAVIEQVGEGRPYANGNPEDTVCPKADGGQHDMAG